MEIGRPPEQEGHQPLGKAAHGQKPAESLSSSYQRGRVGDLRMWKRSRDGSTLSLSVSSMGKHTRGDETDEKTTIG